MDGQQVFFFFSASSGGGASSRLKLGDYQVKSCFLGDQFSKVEINAHPKYVLQWPTHYLGGLMHYYMELQACSVYIGIPSPMWQAVGGIHPQTACKLREGMQMYTHLMQTAAAPAMNQSARRN